MAVLRAALTALETIQTPGGIVHLPFEWEEKADPVTSERIEDPPIVKHILRHPWQLPRLLRREVPE